MRAGLGELLDRRDRPRGAAGDDLGADDRARLERIDRLTAEDDHGLVTEARAQARHRAPCDGEVRRERHRQRDDARPPQSDDLEETLRRQVASDIADRVSVALEEIGDDARAELVTFALDAADHDEVAVRPHRHRLQKRDRQLGDRRRHVLLADGGLAILPAATDLVLRLLDDVDQDLGDGEAGARPLLDEHQRFARIAAKLRVHEPLAQIGDRWLRLVRHRR